VLMGQLAADRARGSKSRRHKPEVVCGDDWRIERVMREGFVVIGFRAAYQQRAVGGYLQATA